jgi:hypothetical protein
MSTSKLLILIFYLSIDISCSVVWNELPQQSLESGQQIIVNSRLMVIAILSYLQKLSFNPVNDAIAAKFRRYVDTANTGEANIFLEIYLQNKIYIMHLNLEIKQVKIVWLGVIP